MKNSFEMQGGAGGVVGGNIRGGEKDPWEVNYYILRLMAFSC